MVLVATARTREHVGDGFWNRSYLMVHLLTLATYWFYFRQRQRFLLLSICLQIEDAFSICTVNYVLVQIYKCGSLLNPRQLNFAKLSTQFIYTMNHVQVFLNNVATTIEFFDKHCVIFPQHFKCTSAVLKSVRPRQPNALPIHTWLIFKN